MSEPNPIHDEIVRLRQIMLTLSPAERKLAETIAQAVEPLVASLSAAEARVERLEKRVNAALDDACRMSAILLMAGEMSPQERRTAQAVANGLAAKVRSALSEATPQGEQ